MRTKTQILYGPYNMSNLKCHIDRINERSLPSQKIQKQIISRQDGSIKVADRYADKMIKGKGYLKLPTNSSNTFREIENEFDNSISKKSRTFRVARRWIKMFDLDTDSGWSAGGDTVNITTDPYNYMVSTASLNFDIDVNYSGNDYASLENTGLTAVDLSDVEETGNIEFWIFLEDSEEVEDIDVKWGSDSSNYWESTSISTNYENNNLETGWNYISIYWATAETTGSPDSSAIDYMYFQINYTSDQEDSQNNKLSGVRWVDEEEVTNYAADSVTVDKSEDPHHIDYQPFTFNLTALKGLAVATHETYALANNTVTAAQKNKEIRMYGSYRPKPTIVYTLSSVGNLAEIEYVNRSSDESISVSTAFDVGDTIKVDTDTLQCTLNNNDVSYSGVFPRHIIGLNKVRTTQYADNSDTQQQLTQDSTLEGTSDKQFFAQSFQPGVTGSITQVQLYLKYLERLNRFNIGFGELGVCQQDDGTTVGVALYSDSGGEPNAELATIGTIGVGSASYDWLTKDLTTPYAVTSGTTYWLVVDVFYAGTLIDESYCGDTDSRTGWGSNSAGGYASGSVKSSDDLATWTSETGDSAFKVITEPEGTAELDWSIYYKKRYI